MKFSNSIGESNISTDDIVYIGYLPSNLKFVIDNNSSYTFTSLVNLSINAERAEDMCFRNGTKNNWTGWEPYKPNRTLFLANNENNSVHFISVKFRNEVGESRSINDSIRILRCTPLNSVIRINNGDNNTDSSLIMLDITAEFAEEMCFRNGSSSNWTSWEPYETKKELFLEGTGDGWMCSIFAKFRNAYGESDIVSSEILYTSPYILIQEIPDIVILGGIFGGLGATVILSMKMLRRRKFN